jgi:N-acetylglucosaminyldiphosphoundecaprenol N-acetyl-beta-D-mannosaminyltransferase
LRKITAPVQIGVGAAFDFHSGHIKRAPLWMQKYGLEWLFRMLQDRRLIKRYLTTNPVFVVLFLRDFVLVNFRNMTKKLKGKK